MRTAVFFGMLGVAILGLFFTQVFYVAICTLTARGLYLVRAERHGRTAAPSVPS